VKQKHYLFYLTQNYSYEILRPLQKEIIGQGDRVCWFLAGDEISDYLTDAETRLKTVQEVIDFNPIASFVPGNHIPSFFPGLKVQIFHGLEWKKKGHFKIRDCFDLYCTHGPITTDRFNILKGKHRSFEVIETGWPKIDALFDAKTAEFPELQGPIILYAPTFSPKLTSAPALFDTIRTLSTNTRLNWIVKFHPKMDPAWILRYKQIGNPQLKVIETQSIGPLLKAADLLVSDTSSVIGEFAILRKPAITFDNLVPEDSAINITQPSALAPAINDCLMSNDPALKKRIEENANRLHPYYDSDSSQRVLQAAQEMIDKDLSYLQPKPVNVFRNLKMRRMLRYWKL